MFARTYDNAQEMAEFVPPIYPKNKTELDAILALLRNSFLTKNLNHKELKIIADAMFLKQYKAGEVIIRYGEIGSEYYVLKSGSIDVVVYKEGTKPTDSELDSKILRTKTLPAGVGFGELALLYNDKRTATVRAAQDCAVWVLEGKVFKNIIIKQSMN